MTPTLPLDEQNIRSIVGDTSYYYGFNVTLTQADVPYEIGNNGRPKSASHFVVCADTVTVASTLVNPGMDVRISARQVIFQKGAVIDTSGPDATPDNYAPGVPAQQSDLSPAATGAGGATGSPGAAPGNIVIFAESIIGASGLTDGAVVIQTPLESAISLALPNAPKSINYSALNPTPVADISWPLNLAIVTGTLKFTGLNVQGFGIPAITSATIDMMARKAVVSLSYSGLTLSGNAELNLKGLSPQTYPLTGSNFAIAFSCDYSIDLSGAALVFQTGSETPFEFTKFSPSIQLPPSLSKAALDLFVSTQIPVIQASVATAIHGGLEKGFSEAGPFAYSLAPDVVLMARGGTGGRGQDGHAGIQGPQGAEGKTDGSVIANGPFDSYSGPVPPDSIGQSGGRGGQGGDAGKSGQGATGGNVQIGFVTAAPAVLNLDYSGGDGGPSASPGAPGRGGEPGAAGSFTVVMPAGPYTQSNTEPSYSEGPGPGGPLANFQGAIGNPGQAGAGTVNGLAATPGGTYTPVSYSTIAPAFPVEQWQISQHAVTFAYLNAESEADYRQVAESLNWMANVTAPFLVPGFTPAGWSATDIAAVQQINAFANTLLSNYRAGLDFYGNAPNWVPVLTLNEYQGFVQSMIDVGTIIEAQFQTYINEQNTQEARLQAVNDSSTSIGNVLTTLQAQVDSIQGVPGTVGQLAQVDATITSLTEQLQVQITTIKNDETVFTNDFRAAVEKDTCSFMDVINGVASIISVGSDIADGVGSITDALSAVSKAEDAISGFTNCIKVIQNVASTVDKIQDGLNTIQTVLKGADPSTSVGLLVTDQNDFDTLIGQYTGQFPSAVVLKQAVDDYFALINNRNQAIVNYNGLYLSMVGLQNQIAQYTAQQEQLAALQAQNQPDPALPGYIAWMQAVYGSLKTAIVRQLYGENRAYYFWSLIDEPFSTDDLTVASLAATHADLLQKLATQKEQQQAAQPLTQSIFIAATDIPMAFAQLAQSRKLTFSIPKEHPAFSEFFQVIVTSFTLAFPDIRNSTDKLFVNVTHAGTSTMVRAADRVALVFTHLPRVAPFTIDYGDPANTSGGLLGSSDQGYVGVSPFAVWTINFDYSDNAWLALSSIQSVEVKFTGTYFGPSSRRKT